MAQTLRLFQPHPNLSDTVNRRIIQSEIEGGVFLADLPPASVLEIQTQHHDYRAVTLAQLLHCYLNLATPNHSGLLTTSKKFS